MLKVKICGITNEEDAVLAERCGADFIGFVIGVPVSTPRKISLQRAVEISKKVKKPVVAVIMPKSIEEVEKVVGTLRPWAVQLHGNETEEFVRSLRSRVNVKIIKTVQNYDAQVDRLNGFVDFMLVDDKSQDWSSARKMKERANIPLILAGGLTPENVAKAVQTVKPWAVDVASGVESLPGKKDAEKIKKFIKNAR